jgi:Transposase IS116/IS110/IS902 family
MTHPGVGPITAWATDVFLGDPTRFVDGKALASYVGIIPREYSSGGRQRLGGLTKQGNPLLRFLWCEAAIHAVGKDAELQRFYLRKLFQKGLGKARVAAARKLGIRLWILLRDQIDYNEFCRRGQMRQKNGGTCAGMPARVYKGRSQEKILLLRLEFFLLLSPYDRARSVLTDRAMCSVAGHGKWNHFRDARHPVATSSNLQMELSDEDRRLLIGRLYCRQRGRDGVNHQTYHFPVIQFVTAPVMKKKNS